jgi:hypothetical protein
MKDKLMNHIQTLEKCIKYNDRIMHDYLENPDNKINCQNLLKLGSSIKDIYENNLKEFELCKNEIRIIYKQSIEELKNNYLNDFNKKYNFDIQDIRYIGFKHFPEFNKLDEMKFEELCRIYFKNIKELELKFENDIDIKPFPAIKIDKTIVDRFDPFIKTGHYNSHSKEITLNVNNRHIKDILRTLCHELIHHY